jgi:uncharacterized protein with HEPN domain
MWRDDALLLDMLIAARKSLRFTQGIDWTHFEQDELVQNAVMYVVQIIGEAATKISDDFKSAHSQIPWQAIKGMRHRLVHDYTRIDLPTVWRVVETHIPELIRMIEPLIPPDVSGSNPHKG